MEELDHTEYRVSASYINQMAVLLPFYYVVSFYFSILAKQSSFLLIVFLLACVGIRFEPVCWLGRGWVVWLAVCGVLDCLLVFFYFDVFLTL